VSGKVVPVRIDAESPRAGWTGTNQATGKQVRIKSARRLRYAMAKKDGKWQRVAAGAAKDATRANVGGKGATRGKGKAKKKAKGDGKKKGGSRAPVKGGAAWPAPGKPAEAKSKKAKVDAWRKDVADKTRSDPEERRKQNEKERRAKAAAKRGRKAKPKAKAKRTSLLDVAAEVLAKADGPMNAKAIIEKVLATGRWQTKGATPEATLYSGLTREISKKGDEARFEKVERGKFQLVK